MESVNKFVAVEPFKHEGLKPKVVGGLATLKTKSELQALKVLYPASGSDYLPGDVVYVRGDAVVADWAKNVYTLPGVEQTFVLCPEGEIKLVERVPRPLPPLPQPAPWLFLNTPPNPNAGGGIPYYWPQESTILPLKQPEPIFVTSDVKPVGHGG